MKKYIASCSLMLLLMPTVKAQDDVYFTRKSKDEISSYQYLPKKDNWYNNRNTNIDLDVYNRRNAKQNYEWRNEYEEQPMLNYTRRIIQFHSPNIIIYSSPYYSWGDPFIYDSFNHPYYGYYPYYWPNVWYYSSAWRGYYDYYPYYGNWYWNNSCGPYSCYNNYYSYNPRTWGGYSRPYGSSREWGRRNMNTYSDAFYNVSSSNSRYYDSRSNKSNHSNSTNRTFNNRRFQNSRQQDYSTRQVGGYVRTNPSGRSFGTVNSGNGNVSTGGGRSFGNRR